jgi:hypothetical protein
MSIQLHEENGGTLIVVQVGGKLVKADYEQFVPESERLAMVGEKVAAGHGHGLQAVHQGTGPLLRSQRCR